jgi:hypothetical protein
VWFVFKGSAIFRNHRALKQVRHLRVVSSRFCRRDDKLCHLGIAQLRHVPTQIWSQSVLRRGDHFASNAKGATDFSVAPRLAPSTKVLLQIQTTAILRTPNKLHLLSSAHHSALG